MLRVSCMNFSKRILKVSFFVFIINPWHVLFSLEGEIVNKNVYFNKSKKTMSDTEFERFHNYIQKKIKKDLDEKKELIELEKNNYEVKLKNDFSILKKIQKIISKSTETKDSIDYINTIDISKSNIDEKSYEKIFKHLGKIKIPTIIDISKNDIGFKVISDLSELLKKNIPIIGVNLSDNVIESKDLLVIIKSIKLNTNLKWIDLSDNLIEIGSKHEPSICREICKLFMYNKTIEDINLSDNFLDIEDENHIKMLISKRKAFNNFYY